MPPIPPPCSSSGRDLPSGLSASQAPAARRLILSVALQQSSLGRLESRSPWSCRLVVLWRQPAVGGEEAAESRVVGGEGRQPTVQQGASPPRAAGVAWRCELI